MSEPHPDPDPGKALALRALGSTYKLAALLGLKQPTVQQWIKVPPHHVAAICDATELEPHQLRPDLWKPPAAQP